MQGNNDRPKVLLSIDHDDWAFARIAQKLVDRWGGYFDFATTTLHRQPPSSWNHVDLLICLWWLSSVNVKKRVDCKKTVVAFYDHFTWKQSKNYVRQVLKNSDGIIFANELLAAEFQGEFGKLDIPNWVCEDGVDTSLFAYSPSETINKDFRIGWAGNSKVFSARIKGLDLLTTACKNLHVPLEIADKKNGMVRFEDMPKFFSKCSIGVFPSEAEGTPNPLLECMSVGRPVAITNGIGLSSKLIQDGVNGAFIKERTVEGVMETINRLRKINLVEAGFIARKAVEEFDWKRKIEAWTPIMDLAGNHNGRAVTVPPQQEHSFRKETDYSDILTVFLISSDNYNANACTESLKKQDCKFRFMKIHNVYPMDKAFQRMLDLCETEYFIQVDCDFILNPDAISRLIKEIKNANEKVAFVAGALWDVTEELSQTGIKIYRHNVMKNYPYRSSPSCEVDQWDRLANDGYVVKIIWKGYQDKSVTFGLHGAVYTPKTVYSRIMRLTMKDRTRFEIPHSYPYLKKFLDKYIKSPTELNLYALLGATAGSVIPLDSFKEEDDYRKAPVGFNQLQSRLVSGPKAVNFYVTSKCNHSCWFCKRQSFEINSLELTSDIVKKTLEKFPMIKSACFAGFGEPLLNPHLKMCLESTKGLFTSVITNGILITKNPWLLESSVSMIAVSLNSISQKEHEFNSQTVGNFESVVNGIKILANGNKNVEVSFIIHKENIERMKEYVSFASSLGVKKIILHNLLPSFSNGDYKRFKELVLTVDDQEKIDEQMSLIDHNGLTILKPKVIDFNSCPRSCQSPFISIGVDGKGNISGCRRVMPPDPLNGNILQENVWSNKYFRKLRGCMSFDHSLPEACQLCFGNWWE